MLEAVTRGTRIASSVLDTARVRGTLNTLEEPPRAICATCTDAFLGSDGPYSVRESFASTLRVPFPPSFRTQISAVGFTTLLR
jgi:hypothetical protein